MIVAPNRVPRRFAAIHPLCRQQTMRLAMVPAILILATGLASCGRQQPPMPPDGRVPVVATFSILGDIAANVGGDRIALTTLVGPNGDAHAYEPTPGDAQILAGAAVVFENGLGFETWLDKLCQASQTTARRVIVTQGITPRTLIEGGRQETDPHCWHDVRNTIEMTREVADALAQADPAGAATYQANARTYLANLDELDRYIAAQVRTLPPERRVLLTSHDSLGYFARRYGFRVLGASLTSVSTEAGDPSARKIAAVIQEIRQAGVPAIFTENMENPKLMEQIAAEAGVRVDTSLYTDALGAKGSPGETYLKMMRANVDTLVGLLKP